MISIVTLSMAWTDRKIKQTKANQKRDSIRIGRESFQSCCCCANAGPFSVLHPNLVLCLVRLPPQVTFYSKGLLSLQNPSENACF